MDNQIETKIESLFRNTVRNDSRIKNAFLLVHSEQLNIHINIAEGTTGKIKSVPQQPNYMASVGKLFTSVTAGLMHERGELSFDDKISNYLDNELVNGLHIYKGIDYSEDIQIRHLLNQTSGLPDNFYPLFDRLLKNPGFNITPYEAVFWAKKNLTPKAPPGKKAFYTDTNYHLLGLIIEKIRGTQYHKVLSDLIFLPLGMKNSFMLHSSDPLLKSGLPVAEFYKDNILLNELKGFSGIDYAGGGVVAPLEELLIFMKALVSGKLVNMRTLNIMKNDKSRLYPNFDYGYGIWILRPIPFLIPDKLSSWGVLGATGAFMFYHPKTDLYLIGNFNHSAYQRKCVRFMFRIINSVLKQMK